MFRKRGHRGDEVEVLYNPVDVAAFASASASDAVRAELGGRPGAPLIGTVGRIHPRKDLETFVRAAAQVALSVPQARFVVVGAAEAPVEKIYAERLSRLVEQLGLRDRLTFAGARRDITAVMQALDIFVLTSRHEGFGRVVAEGMAAGRPVVATAEGALPELLDGGKLGRLAPAEDAAAFAEQISGLLADRPAAAALGAAARRGGQQFDARAIAARVWTRYQDLVERAGSGLNRELGEASRPALEGGEGEQLASDVLSAQVSVDERPHRAGIEPELLDQGTLGQMGTQRIGGGLSKPAVHRNLEAAFGPIGQPHAHARLQEPAHQALVSDGTDLVARW